MFASALRTGYGAAHGQRPIPSPPTDPFFSSVVALASFDGVDAATAFTDESPSAHGAFNFSGDAELDTAQKKFGTSSCKFDGAGDFLTLPDDIDWTFGTGEFVVECFAKFNTVGVAQSIIAQTSGSATSFSLQANSSGNLTFIWDDGGGFDFISGGTLGTSAFHHVVAERDASDDLRIFIDGVVAATRATMTDNLQNIALGLHLGIRGGGTLPLDGWMDELRITKGASRYGAAFTPPTEAFPRS